MQSGSLTEITLINLTNQLTFLQTKKTSAITEQDVQWQCLDQRFLQKWI